MSAPSLQSSRSSRTPSPQPPEGVINRNITRYETTAVYTHPDAKVDIILVHGLNGSPSTTWRSADGVYWPTDLLPLALRDAPVNVLVYGYNADVYGGRHGGVSASDNFIYQHAQTLVSCLTLFRRSEGWTRNPIIWVAHSLGGILLKRALLYSNDLKVAFHEPFRSIYVSTYGIIFLGTPHMGADAASWGCILQAMAEAVVPRRFFESEGVLLKTLRRDSETLANVNSQFLDIFQRFRIHMVHENHKTDIKGTKMVIVDSSSASPQLPGVTYYGVEATHSDMCKFNSPCAPGFRALSTDVRQWVLDAPAVIRRRWMTEDEEAMARARLEMQERITPLDSARTNASRCLEAGPGGEASHGRSTVSGIIANERPTIHGACLSVGYSGGSSHGVPIEVDELSDGDVRQEVDAVERVK